MATQETIDKRPVSEFADIFDAVVDNVSRVIKGKEDPIRLALICLSSEGHLLLEDVPGVGKTTLAKALARSFDLEWQRIQFTPDLLPSDVTGVNVYDRSTGAFEFRPGGIFANVVLGDEINRASPKTQSALLEAMQEQQVTIDRTTHRLPKPFFVIATQNPVEHHGTFPLPESQLDRFLMRIRIGYPDAAAEAALLDDPIAGDGGGQGVGTLRPVVDAGTVGQMAKLTELIHVAPGLKDYIVSVANYTRRSRSLALGMSPRATLALQRAARARAASVGRTYATPEDVRHLLVPVLEHRLVLTPEAQMSGHTVSGVLNEAARSVPVPSPRLD